MSTHNICFYGEMGENYPRINTKYSSLLSPLGYSFVCNEIPVTCFHEGIRQISILLDKRIGTRTMRFCIRLVIMRLRL